MQLRRASDHALTGRDIGEHPGKQVLHELERRDRLSELQTLLGVSERVFVGAHLAPGCFPPHEKPRHAQHFRRIAERAVLLEPILFRDAAFVEGDQAVLYYLQRNLVLNLLHAEAGSGLVLDNETFDLIIGDITRPDDRDVAPGGIPDPLLLAVDDPRIALTLCG